MLNLAGLKILKFCTQQGYTGLFGLVSIVSGEIVYLLHIWIDTGITIEI
jgi:hypothetical protein